MSTEDLDAMKLALRILLATNVIRLILATFKRSGHWPDGKILTISTKWRVM